MPQTPAASRRARRALASLSCSFALAAAGACSDDEDTAPTPVGPKGTIQLSILSVETTSGASVPGDSGGELSLACDGLVHVRVELDNWILRPPNACGGANQCGWLLLRIDPAVEGAQTIEERSATCIEGNNEGDDPCRRALITVDADALATLEASFHVELRYGDGTPVVMGASALSDEVSVRLLAAAGCASSGDAAPDAPEAGAEGGEAGTAPPDSSAAGDAADAGDATDEASSDSPADAPGEVGDAPAEGG